MEAIKCVLVGDSASDKTCVATSYCTQQFPSQHVPTVYDHFDTIIKIDGVEKILGIWDTSDQNEHASTRTLCYHEADVVLICFSIGNRDSFLNVRNQWYPEVKHYLPRVPRMLIGTEADLRGSAREQLRQKSDNLVSYTEGVAMAKKIGARQYVECSAKTHQGLKAAFAGSAKIALDVKQRGNSSSGCTIS